MTSTLVFSILSQTSQVLGHVRRWAILPSSSSDPRSSVFKDLKKLERTLKRIQAVLHDAEEREIRDESVKLWLKELKEVAYEAEDVLDEFQYEELRAQVEDRASRKRKRMEGDDEEEVSIPVGMGDRIREIRERFDEISEDRKYLSLKEEDGERRVYKTIYPEPTSHMVDESSIYGREHDKMNILDLLLFSEGVGNDISVIPIVGKGGLGKTTIAQLVYKELKDFFDLTGWVCVSDDFDVPRLTKAIIESLTRSPCDLTQLSTLQETLKEKVKGKRVLLVLDDVWNEQQSRWESLRNPFVGAGTITIIVTCRNESVAKIMQTVHPYHPSYLSPKQSWSLFRHYAFGGRNPKEQPRLADIGKQIVKKCSGLPLALKSIGSLLRYMPDEESWMDVIQNDIWEVDENNEILPAFRVSYSRMPAHLKPCFVYCSMFPKDYGFGKDELVRLWLAQGYILSEGGRTMEDIGYEYFNDLQRRSFFDSYWSDFKMHDMIHDLAKSIAGNECYAIVDKKLPGLPNEVRHLYVNDKEEFVSSPCSYNFRALRTLFIQYWFRFSIEIQEIIKNSQLLRTLQFCWEGKDEIPDFLGNLNNLRYLHITSNNIKKLPESICLLYHLQILILDCRDLAELPDGLGDLTNLQQLCIMADQIPCLPAGIGKLTNLQSLRGCYKVQGGIGVLKDLVNLQGNLCISRLRNMVNMEDAKEAGLKLKHKLEQLFLHWNAVNCENDPHHEIDDALLHLEDVSGENMDVQVDGRREEAMLEYLQPHTNLKKLLINGYGGSRFPEWVANPFSLASLQELHIIDCEKIWSLPQLRHLSNVSFASLQELHIINCEKIWSLPQLRHLSNVRYLHIEKCQQLTTLQGMQNLTSLKTLIIQNCPRLQIMAEDQLSSMPEFVEILDCPGLSNWCLIRNLNCIQVASGNKLTISNTWENIMHGFDDLASIKHLYFGNHWNSFLQKDSIFALEELTIWSCTDILPLQYLPELASLRRLVIKDCPRIISLPSRLLPSTLKSFIVDSCENLCYLPLAQENRDAFEELQLMNCPKLATVEGLKYRFSPKNLRIERCPQLRLRRRRVQLYVPWRPPQSHRSEYSEETENIERIDDGTQEKQVLDRVKIEHTNSAVSSIFDAADAYNMRRHSSESWEQPWLADKEAKMDCEIEDDDCNHDKITGSWDHLTTRMETMVLRDSDQPCAESNTDPGPSRLPEPPTIYPQQQVASPDSQPDATVTFIDHDHSAVSPIFDNVGDVILIL